MKVWVITSHSESGDDYGPFVFSYKPDKKLQKRIAFACDGTEEEDGPGDFGSYVFQNVDERIVDDLSWLE